MSRILIYGCMQIANFHSFNRFHRTSTEKIIPFLHKQKRMGGIMLVCSSAVFAGIIEVNS